MPLPLKLLEDLERAAARPSPPPPPKPRPALTRAEAERVWRWLNFEEGRELIERARQSQVLRVWLTPGVTSPGFGVWTGVEITSHGHVIVRHQHKQGATGRHLDSLDALLDGAEPALRLLADAIADGTVLQQVRVEGWDEPLSGLAGS
jgi:hypothetical protein